MLIKTYFIMFRLIQIINFLYRIFRMRMGDVKMNMSKSQKYILMNREDEVLSFKVKFGEQHIVYHK